MVHDYTGVIYDEIFDIVLNDIPSLRNSYMDILTIDCSVSNSFINDYIDYFKKNRKFKDIKTSI